jgi:predicted HNH restriction endonuclease
MNSQTRGLDDAGRRLLQLLISHFPKVKAGQPNTYIGYKQALDALNLPSVRATYGESLQVQGLNSLAEWTHREGHPAITGLIIDLSKFEPGHGYFKLFGHDADDDRYDWWKGEIEKSLAYNWAPYSDGHGSTGESWSDEELRASVSAYLEMAGRTRNGEPVNKTEAYVGLAAKFGRSPKAFEYRMQNISYVLSLMGRDWLRGLRPASNVGAKNAERIEALIMEIENRPVPAVAGFEVEVRNALAQHSASPPEGSKAPPTQTGETTQFKRDPAVKAWVLSQANGICECCAQPAPFKAGDGRGFLELHHVRMLSAGGSDTVCNAVAICPNCHRALHYSIDAKKLVERLYATVARLLRE